MSLQSAVQHIASAFGAFVSSLLLSETANHDLKGMPTIASISIVLALALPVLLRQTERFIRVREGQPLPATAVRA